MRLETTAEAETQPCTLQLDDERCTRRGGWTRREAARGGTTATKGTTGTRDGSCVEGVEPDRVEAERIWRSRSWVLNMSSQLWWVGLVRGGGGCHDGSLTYNSDGWKWTAMDVRGKKRDMIYQHLE